MKSASTWIDPRIAQVRSSSAQAYLRQRGWKELPLEQANLLPFAAPGEEEEAPVVVVPLREQARDYPQRTIEMIIEVALFDQADVLSLPPRNIDGTAWQPTQPTLAVETDLLSTDEYEVLVFDHERDRRLVAAIEIVSPANKDREKHRQAFVGKCE